VHEFMVLFACKCVTTVSSMGLKTTPSWLRCRENSGARYTGGCVGQKACLDATEKRTISFSLCQKSNLYALVVHPVALVAILTELQMSLGVLSKSAVIKWVK
jgi:hypothetical protein